MCLFVVVAKREPTVKFPTVELDVMEPPKKSIGEVVALYTIPDKVVGVKGYEKKEEPAT